MGVKEITLVHRVGYKGERVEASRPIGRQLQKFRQETMKAYTMVMGVCVKKTGGILII